MPPLSGVRGVLYIKLARQVGDTIYCSGSQTGGKLPLTGSLRFLDEQRGTKITMFVGIMSNHCKRNFRPEKRKIFIGVDNTESLR